MRPDRHFGKVFLVAVTSLLGSGASAGTIIWENAQNISTSTEVNNEGTLVIARQATGGTGVPPGNADQTVNGVPFSGTQNTQSGVTFSLDSGWGGFDPVNYMSTKTLSGPDAVAYRNMLVGGWFSPGATTSFFSLTGLTLGQDYLFQFWVNDYREYTNNRNEQLTLVGYTNVNTQSPVYLGGDGTNPGSGRGQYVIGRFTADTTTAQFQLVSNDSSQLNAFQLRAVPEPGSVAMLAFGGLCLACTRLRRR